MNGDADQAGVDAAERDEERRMERGGWVEGMSDATCPECLDLLPCTEGGYLRSHGCDGDLQVCVERQEVVSLAGRQMLKERAEIDAVKPELHYPTGLDRRFFDVEGLRGIA